MRLGEDVIRYMTIKQEGPLPTPKPKIKPSETANNQDVKKSEDDSSTTATAKEDNLNNNSEKSDIDKTNE